MDTNGVTPMYTHMHISEPGKQLLLGMHTKGKCTTYLLPEDRLEPGMFYDLQK